MLDLSLLSGADSSRAPRQRRKSAAYCGCPGRACTSSAMGESGLDLKPRAAGRRGRSRRGCPLGAQRNGCCTPQFWNRGLSGGRCGASSPSLTVTLCCERR